MDRGLGEQPFVSTVSIWLICLMFERRKRHGFKNKNLYRQLLEAFFGVLLRFRYHLYRNNAPHRGGDFIGTFLSFICINTYAATVAFPALIRFIWIIEYSGYPFQHRHHANFAEGKPSALYFRFHFAQHQKPRPPHLFQTRHRAAA